MIDWEKVWYPAFWDGILTGFMLIWPLLLMAIAARVAVSIVEKLARGRRRYRRRW